MKLLRFGNGIQTATLPVKHAPYGLCYLHLQTVSDHGDAGGIYVKTLEFQGE